MSTPEETDDNAVEIQDAVGCLSSKLDADIILFNDPISEPSAAFLHELLQVTPLRFDTVFLMLVTYGGDAHAAYVIARDLQTRYKKVIICIAGDCYSAGTLIVLCANEVVITDRGRLGPLDVQLLKKDELSERLSGLTVSTALEELSKQTAQTAASVALTLMQTFRPQLSFKTALDMASSMTAQMFGEVYKQIDPIRLGEDARSLRIAEHYGNILGTKSANLKTGAVRRLARNYPSHECIIDRTEAEELFINLREPSSEESSLLRLLDDNATDASYESGIVVLTTPRQEESDDQNNRRAADDDASQERTVSKARGAEILATGNGATRKTDSSASSQKAPDFRVSSLSDASREV